jgi:LPXTG-motif cell wall-anchored protein
MYEGTHLSATLTNTKALTSGGNPVVLSAIDAIEIVYKAHLNTDAVVDGNGIPNQATIIYSNNPNTNGKGESTPDETNVYPINLNLLKVDGKDKTVTLAGAQFLLSRDYSDGMITHKEFAVVEGGKLKEWAHHAEGDGCAADNADHLAAVAANELGTVLTTDATGNINVGGLDAGKFTLIEIKAPDGYNKLVEEIVISVSITVDETNDKIETMAGMTNQGQVSFNAATATVKLTIDNYKGDVLPSTGGIGTTLFYIFGGLMAAGAAVLLVTKKRMSAEA